MKRFSKEDIGAILKGLRVDANMTQNEAADAIGRKRQVISHWETGYTQPDADTLIALCAVYKADIGDAFGFPRNIDISKHEQAILEAYRESPEILQSAIGRILMVATAAAPVVPSVQKPSSDTVRMFRAAKSESNKEGGIVDMPRSTLDKLRNAPAVTSNDDI